MFRHPPTYRFQNGETFCINRIQFFITEFPLHALTFTAVPTEPKNDQTRDFQQSLRITTSITTEQQWPPKYVSQEYGNVVT